MPSVTIFAITLDAAPSSRVSTSGQTNNITAGHFWVWTRLLPAPRTVRTQLVTSETGAVSVDDCGDTTGSTAWGQRLRRATCRTCGRR
eukprot:1108852-Prymnesium_polylepis.1